MHMVAVGHKRAPQYRLEDLGNAGNEPGADDEAD